MEVSWVSLKLYATSKSLPIQYITLDANYYIKVADAFFELECFLPLNVDNSDTLDFETNFKPTANKPIEPIMKPTAFGDPGQYRFRGSASEWTSVTYGVTGSVSTILSTDSTYYVNGGEVITEAANVGDWCRFDVTAGGQVVETFIKKWFVLPGNNRNAIILPYVAAIPANCAIKVSYKNTGVASIGFGVNLYVQRIGVGT
jgi:hypothetical protein